MDAVVQLIRNALCCVKDLNLLSDTFLYDAKLVNKTFSLLAFHLPSPLSETTPLEVAISISQFYAFVSVSRAGYSLLQSSFKRIRYLNQQQQQQVPPPSSSSSQQQQSQEKQLPPVVVGLTTATLADRLVRQGLAQAQAMAWRDFFIGCNVLPIGIAFFWLFANSWHVTSTNWIGGLQGVIHALTVMEVCLLPLLYYMLVNAHHMLYKAVQFPKLAVLVQAGNLKADHVTLPAYQTMAMWKPFWDTDMTYAQPAPTKITARSLSTEKSPFQKEVDDVKQTLETLLSDTTTTTTTDTTTSNGKTNNDKNNDGEKEEKILLAARTLAAGRLQSQAMTLQLDGYREYLYFVLNFIAFYGYLLSVICYYSTEGESPTHETWYVRQLKLGMTHADADWHGNFAGDLMWTIEPMIILFSPRIMQWIIQRRQQRDMTTTAAKIKFE